MAEKEEALLKQYEIFSQRKLHFGRLFWQIPATFVALCVVLTGIFRNAKEPLKWWLLLVAGAVLVLISYIAHKLQVNEDLYEILMHNIETSLRKSFGDEVQYAPSSKKLGARFWTTVMLVSFGFVLMIISTLKIL